MQPNEARGEDRARFEPAFWARIVAVAVGGGLAGAALLHLLKAVQHFSYGYHHGEFYDGVVGAPWWRRLAVLAVAGVVGAVGAHLEPGSAGHGGGLQETIWFRDGRVPFWKTVARAVVSITGVGMGVSLGREGALKQTGSAFASLFAGKHTRGPQRRLLAAAGAGAGIAAAYNVPLGGALFGMEVLLGAISVELAVPMLIATTIAAAITRRLVQDGPIYQLQNYAPSLAHVAWALVAGPLCGLVAAGWVRWVGFVDAHKPKKGAAPWIAPLAVCLALGGASLVLPQLLGNGRNVVHATLLGGVPLTLLVVLVVAKPLATGLCLGSGIPGGLFTPTCCLGALVGELTGRALGAAWPAAPDGSYALLGMVALLAAATHGPISAIVLAAELTDNAGMVLPALVACASATLVARLLEPRSLYSARVHARMTTATRKGALAVISSAARYSMVATRLATLPPDEPLHVLDDKGMPIGRIVRDGLEERRKRLAPTANIVAADLVQS